MYQTKLILILIINIDYFMGNKFAENGEQFISVNYKTWMGDLRIRYLMEDLRSLHSLFSRELNILDIGAGHAPVTLRILSELPGSSATLVEPSESLLIDSADKLMEELNIDKLRVIRIQSTFEDYLGKHDTEKDFNLLINHVVINWSSDPYLFLKRLINLMTKPDQICSLVIGTTLGHEMKYACMGQIDLLFDSLRNREKPIKSLTYGNDMKVTILDPRNIVEFLEVMGMEIILKSGVKVFSEYIPENLIQSDDVRKKIIEIENEIRFQEPYWYMGNLSHIVFKRKNI